MNAPPPHGMPTDRAVPGVGDLAPDFTLRRTFEDSVSLGQWTARSAVLLAFYVFDFGRV